MIFEQLNDIACKTYLIMNDKDNRAILVDPVISKVQEYIGLMQEKGWNLTHVIDTHTHADHISAGPLLKDMSGCEYIMHELAPAQCVTRRVKDGDVLRLNDMEIKILHTPGHTRDSVTLLVDGKALTGDVLFLDEGGGGRDDLPGGDSSQHWKSLEILRKLPDYIMVYPGHDYAGRTPSTIGEQKRRNPHLKERSQKEFSEYIDDLKLGPEDWMKDVLKANYDCTRDPQAVGIPEDNRACEIKGMVEGEDKEPEVSYISREELQKELISAESKPTLLDVREDEELKGRLGYIEGIINIPIGSLASRIHEMDPYKDKKIVVICRSGARAAAGARILESAGFENVSVLKGGMLEWRKQE
ncbi:MBL fold metallo-hydrolase [Parasporobacterium paucivorans]|uniref:Glyoxylase, beta-lactamase superfamily II n=1 Tax=Parasporobacterium paucivorans DSM 15970 TaxID=1122934 RepID=A0A1M6GIC0_9FIRM|nr:MBL fold metallo-hydrolase [Parasporobacterium paucivorans]SHJ09705.1 Glyoxylase, beta-lactamase superfamily II [Parasporobacterium paucivorans DSM 15970]